jgi:hypothetical protein
MKRPTAKKFGPHLLIARIKAVRPRLSKRSGIAHRRVEGASWPHAPLRFTALNGYSPGPERPWWWRLAG